MDSATGCIGGVAVFEEEDTARHRSARHKTGGGVDVRRRSSKKQRRDTPRRRRDGKVKAKAIRDHTVEPLPPPPPVETVSAEALRAMSGVCLPRRTEDMATWSRHDAPETHVPALQISRSAEMSGVVPGPVVHALDAAARVEEPVDTLASMREHVPLETRRNVENAFREPDVSKDERACQRGQRCQGRAVNDTGGFTLVEYVPSGEVPEGGSTHMCMLCLIDSVVATTCMYKMNCKEFSGDFVVAPFRVLTGVKGEYSIRRVIMSSMYKYDGPLYPFPFYPTNGWNIVTRVARGPRYLVPPPQPDDSGDIFRFGRR